VGFYSTGPKIRPADLPLDALFRKYTANPVLVIVDIRADVQGLPTQAYLTVEAVVEGRETVRTFAHVPSEVGAYEAEEVGVEHLLRDINDPSVSTVGADVRAKLGGLAALATRLKEVATYLEKIVAGKLPVNNEILYNVQVREVEEEEEGGRGRWWLRGEGAGTYLLTHARAHIFSRAPFPPIRFSQTALSLLPNLSVDPLRTALFEVTNDQHLAIYTASLARAVTGLHDLVVNKAKFKDGEAAPAEEKKDEGKKDEGKKDDKPAAEKEKEGGGKK
jgi:26S proteasome regulatory subunit N8